MNEKTTMPPAMPSAQGGLANASPQIEELAAALAKAQGAVAGVIKAHTARVVSKRTQARYTYTYADLASVLDACRRPLADNGLALIHRPQGRQIETLLLHSSGQWLLSTMPLLVGERPGPQDFGSALTYARRYATMALLGIAAEDDDGEAAQRSTGSERKSERKSERGEKPAEDDGGAQLAEEILQAMVDAESVEALAAVGASAAKLSFGPDVRRQLASTYRSRREALS